jgi:hypothetical protein
MPPVLLSAYVLIWPAIVGGLLFYLVRAFVREWRKSRDENTPMI